MEKKNNTIMRMGKVWRTGGSLVISLPHEFCEANDIKPGDKLPIVGRTDILKIIPRKQ